MMLYPDVQKRAQAEIDRVVGNDRLPNFDDRAELPYIECLVKEILRWKVVSPMGIVHLSSSFSFKVLKYSSQQYLIRLWKMTTFKVGTQFLNLINSNVPFGHRLLDSERVFSNSKRVVSTLGALMHEMMLTIVFRAMSQDETMYSDPEHFSPERFEGDAGKKLVDPHSYAFGFGRRYF